MPGWQDYAGARRAFQECVDICPSYGKAWVSWAQVNTDLALPDSPSVLSTMHMRLCARDHCSVVRSPRTLAPCHRAPPAQLWLQHSQAAWMRAMTSTPGLLTGRCAVACQMEKRSRAAGAGDHLARCRMVLQQGLSLNPDSAPLCQVSLRPDCTPT